MVLEFNDLTNMTMGFETDNKIPTVGQCISYISVNGTYDKIGPILITHIDEQSLNAKSRNLILTKLLRIRQNLDGLKN